MAEFCHSRAADIHAWLPYGGGGRPLTAFWLCCASVLQFPGL